MTTFARFFGSANITQDSDGIVIETARISSESPGSPTAGTPAGVPPIAAPVEGAPLLDQVAEVVRRHVVVQDDDAKKIALFAAHTHAIAAAERTPRLTIIGPTIGCGKTTALKVLSCLVRKPLFVTDVSPAAIYRQAGPDTTWLLDEADTKILSDRHLRHLLNCGFERAGAQVARAGHVFDAFSPVVLALIGDLPESLRDRSIIIPIKRKLPKEKVAPLDPIAQETLAELNNKLTIFAAECHDAVVAANPVMPDGLTNRHADKWEPLLAIADAAGGHWPQTARSLAHRIATAEEAARSPGELVLSDVRSIFAHERADRLPSEYIADSLSELEDRPWPSFNRGRSITQQQLARLLKPFEIGPKTVRFGDYTAKGYYLEDFTEAFERYL